MYILDSFITIGKDTSSSQEESRYVVNTILVYCDPSLCG